MAESKIPKKKIKLGSSINDSGIEEFDDNSTEMHASETPNEVIDDSSEDSDNEDPPIQATQHEEAGGSNPSQSIIGRPTIRSSDGLEKDTSINFTINFLTLWGLTDYITLFKEHNINKEKFLSLGETSEVFLHINDSNDVKRILNKKKTLLNYLKRPDDIQADEVGNTLAKFLKRDPKRKIWLESSLTREIKNDLSKFIVDNILHTQLRRAIPIQPHEHRFWAAEICAIWKNSDPWEWFKPYIFNGSKKKYQGKLFEASKSFNEKISKVIKKVKNDKKSKRLNNLEKVFHKNMAIIEKSKEINEDIVKRWNETRAFRMEAKVRFNTVFQTSKFFTSIDRIKAVLLEDFNFISNKRFPENYLSDLWEKLACHIISLDIKIPDIIQHNQNKLETLQHCTVEMRKDFAWELLSYKMIPPMNSKMNEKGRAKKFKPSRFEAAKSFIRYIENESSLVTTISDHNRQFEKSLLQINPYVIAIKKGFQVLKAIAIVDGKRYECKTLTEAIDLAFKFYVVEDRTYCKLSQCVWRFIEEYLYKIMRNESSQLSSVSYFIGKLENQLQNQENNSVINNL